ncbi:MAG: glycosyltransferase family 2 protein [Bryobacterales bacterium]|nr:glycosyltransferase family 2 protein [Bryobacterales bacterium]
MRTVTVKTARAETAGPAAGWILPEYTADASVVVVNYKTPDMLRRTVSTLLTSEQRSRVEVIVVDNASNDGSAEMVRREFPDVKCIANEVNLGHTGGCNQGMKAAGGRYLFLLNSDTVMRSGVIDRLIEYLDRHPHVGAVAAKVLNPDGSVQGTIKSFPSPWSAICGRYSILARLFPGNRLSRKYLIYREADFDRPFPVDSASACAFMVRREAIEKAGPLDARFFLYWNDVDWCRSIWASGFEIHCVPDSVLQHDQHRGGTRKGPKRLLLSTIDFHVGAYRYYRKWHIRSAWEPANAVAIGGLTARALFVIVAEELRWLFNKERKEA